LQPIKCTNGSDTVDLRLNFAVDNVNDFDVEIDAFDEGKNFIGRFSERLGFLATVSQ
jgi:hypothetical protein